MRRVRGGLGKSSFARVRHVENVENIFVATILPDERITDYFIAHGLPEEFRQGTKAVKYQERGNVNNDEVIDGRVYFEKMGWRPYLFQIDYLYARFLITHPEYVLQNALKFRKLIFYQDATEMSGYVSQPIATSDRPITTRPNSPAPFVFGADWRLAVTDYIPLVLLVVGGLGAAFVGGCRGGALWPAFLMALGAANAVLGFFGDLWQPSEMERHAMIGSVLLRTGGLCGSLLLVDLLMTRKRRAIPTQE